MKRVVAGTKTAREMEDKTVYPNLAGRNVWITGASSGIGEACAYHFSLCKANVLLLARRQDALKRISEKCAKINPTGVQFYVAFDVNWTIAEMEERLSGVPEGLQNCDVLVNNAGLAVGANTLIDTPFEAVEQMIDTNLKGAIKMLKVVVPAMVKRCGVSEGSKIEQTYTIINVGSIAGTEAYYGGSIYCASKFGLQAITEALRIELIDLPVRVTVVRPGVVETNFTTVRMASQAVSDAFYAALDPLVGGDVADLCCYIASRPHNVQIADTLILATQQAKAKLVKPAFQFCTGEKQ